MLRLISIIILLSIIFLAAMAIFLTRPINRDPALIQLKLQREISSIDNSDISENSINGKLKSSWSKKSLMPSFVTPMAGYRPRPAFIDVHDSLYVHCLLMEVGDKTVAFLSYDLLIVPPEVTQKVEKLKEKWGIDFIYLSASHTHNGIGGWDKSVGGQLIAGNYNEEIVNAIVNASQSSINEAQNQLIPTSLTYFNSDGGQLVRNRLNEKSPKDGRISSIEIIRSDSSNAIFTTFSAHATNISSRSFSICNDYPGALINTLESNGYDFAMFMSGTVGSHSTSYHRDEEITDYEFIKLYSEHLEKALLEVKEKDFIGDSVSLDFGQLPVSFQPSQMRVSDNLALRNRHFNKFFTPLNVNIKFLRIGNVLLLGMPCDFSGEIVVENELYQYAEKSGLHLIITSFNGGYIGYITADHQYEEVKRAEVREMNWVGPYHGGLFTEVIIKLIDNQASLR